MTSLPPTHKYSLIAVVLLLILAHPSLTLVHAKDVASKLESGPFLLSANKIIFEQDKMIVVASGNVEISTDDRILMSDKVNYNQKTGIVRAEGNISLLEPSGEVVFANELQLNSELSAGYIKSVRVLLADGSRIAANEANRLEQKKTLLTKAVYSPCDICNTPTRPPLWQIKAARILHSRAEKTIEYQNASIELFGVPIAYTPFFKHPDPTVHRKSGFLSPKFGSTTELGATLQTPYYWALAPDRDFTLEPIFTSDEGVVLTGQYRMAINSGEYAFSASGTRVNKRNDQNLRLDDKDYRGHISGTGKFKIDGHWYWGFNLSRSTDDTYLKRYRISDADVLVSNAFFEGFSDRSYMSTSVYSFQGLAANDRSGNTPIVAPLFKHSWIDGPYNGVTFQIDTDAVSLYRSDGSDTRRISVEGQMRYPFSGNFGDLFNITTQLGIDVYSLNGLRSDNLVAGNSNNGTELRTTPRIAIDWRYPWVRYGDMARLLAEPIVQIIAAPYGGNPAEIPNEDSQSIEFDDTNLLSLNRFPGWDRVESGPRANAGIKLAAYGSEGGYMTAIVGRAFRAKIDDTFARQSGLSKNRSDLVAGATVVPSEYFDLAFRTRLDVATIDPKRNELYLALGPDAFRMTTNYIKLDRGLTVDELEEREEIFSSARWKFAKFWTLTANSVRDIVGDGRQIKAGAGLEYKDECIGLFLNYDRDFTRDRDIAPSTSLNFRIVLQYLG